MNFLSSDYKILIPANDGIYSQGVQGNCRGVSARIPRQGVVYPVARENILTKSTYLIVDSTLCGGVLSFCLLTLAPNAFVSKHLLIRA